MNSSENTDLPDPANAADLPDFIALLDDLRRRTGEPSYRTLARRAGPLMRPPRTVSQSTVGEIFQPRRRRLDLDLLIAVVRALGLDEPAVDGWRQAYLRIQRESKSGPPPGVLRQLPGDLATFTGRAREVSALIEAVARTDASRVPTVVISAIEGMGGVGKTTLAVHVARRLVAAGRFGDVQLYANLRGFDPEHAPSDPAEVLATFLRQVGVPAAQVPEGVDERAAMFRDQLADRDALVLLDNAADEQQIRDLIPTSPGCLVLVTSRRSLSALDGATLFPLDVFSRDEGAALLTQIVGTERITAEPGAADEIVGLCGYLPLAVALAAGRLRSRPAWSLAQMADRLRREGADALALGGRTLRPVFDLSYRGLPDEARRVLRLLGRHPGVDYTVPAVAALADLSHRDTEMVLELLQDEYLLQQKTSGRYELHDLLHGFAAEASAAESRAEGEEAVERLGWWFLHSAYNAAKMIDTPDLPFPTRTSEHGPVTFESYDEALEWFDLEWDNLAAVQRAARDLGLHEIVWQLAVAQKFAAVMRNHLPDFITAHELAVESAKALGDRAVEARVTGGLGLAYSFSGMLDDAGRHYDEALAILRELGDWVRTGPVLINTANLHRNRKNHEKAIALYLESLEVFAKSGAIGGRGTAYLNLGLVHHDRGDFDEAERYYLLSMEDHLTVSAAARADSTKVDDRRGQSMLLGHLARLYLARGEVERAVEGYRETVEQVRVVGDRYLLATTVRALGDALMAAGRDDEAREVWGEALVLFEEIGHEEAASVRERLRGGGAS